MELDELKGGYDVLFSLGHNCLPASQLNHSRIRNIAGVIDWMISPHLSGISAMLRDRFSYLMKRENLQYYGASSDSGCYVIRDSAYDLYSVHDFPLEENDPEILQSYSKLREKLDYRARRFLQLVQSGKRIFFLRTETTPYETEELVSVLNDLVVGEYRLLVVNHAPVSDITPLDYHLRNVCTLLIPEVPQMFQDNHFIWRTILDGIYNTMSNEEVNDYLSKNHNI
ncbi:DUF1796 family putative cysteine peptidase [Paenibacillus sp. Marseille-Q4541]|uniref:DUF1796 family putative cysteine peptidase n=1 Tax=Paenibacillus sp. Marseille-Q4541 TaxID=2831522 RepID=UPI001BA90176|nr:DUF1796 family putative cysteine peptidase [Paenibacillus sp. Marseille-Q4541]